MIISLILGAFLFIPHTNIPNNCTITSNGQPISIVNRADFGLSIPDLPILDSQKYLTFLNRLDTLVTKEPKNAILDNHGNIIPDQPGCRIYRRVFTNQFYTFYYNNGPSKIEVPLLTVYPKVDSELLANIRSKRIGRYITSFKVQNKTRTNNIRLASNAINNYVIFPGETFSFNKVVGKRTAGKGYLKAPVIIKGEFSEDIGGGICQVSSTLFNAVDNAGLQVIQRYSHSREVPYIPPGRDATVSWYGPDFSFKNIYNQPILIRSKTIGDQLVIKLFSSDVIEYRPKKVPYL